MIIYEEVKNPGSTKGWEGEKFTFASVIVCWFFIFFRGKKEVLPRP